MRERDERGYYADVAPRPDGDGITREAFRLRAMVVANVPRMGFTGEVVWTVDEPAVRTTYRLLVSPPPE